MKSVCLVGQLSGPPTVRVEGQRSLTTFTLAVLEPNHAAASFTLSVPCVAWGPAAETAGLLHAEDLVCVQGRL
jgi:single-stranded DNA-binding protein